MMHKRYDQIIDQLSNLCSDLVIVTTTDCLGNYLGKEKCCIGISGHLVKSDIIKTLEQ